MKKKIAIFLLIAVVAWAAGNHFARKKGQSNYLELVKQEMREASSEIEEEDYVTRFGQRKDTDERNWFQRLLGPAVNETMNLTIRLDKALAEELEVEAARPCHILEQVADDLVVASFGEGEEFAPVRERECDGRPWMILSIPLKGARSPIHRA